MRYSFDTNICIRLLKGDSPQIAYHLENTAKSDFYISSVVRFELFYGVFKSKQKYRNNKKLHAFLGYINTVPFDDQSAEIAGKIRTNLERLGTPIGPYDLLIAASALAHDTVLITHNTKEFSRIAELN